MTPPISISALIPELILLVAGCAVLLVARSSRESVRRLAPWCVLIALALALVAVLNPSRLLDWFGGTRTHGSGLAFGPLALFVRIVALQFGALLTLVNWSQARESERGEYLAMMVFSLTGLMLVGAADNLFVLFLALELVSVPTYVMIVLSRVNVRALEAGTKYFFLGALAAAVQAYGFAILYGVSGTAALPEVTATVRGLLADPGSLNAGLAAVGLVLAFGGLLFKVAAVPLHFYIADVYQGAASPVAGLLGFVPKLAGFVALMRIVLMTDVWVGSGQAMHWVLWIVAALSMTVGNVLALRQTNIKRLLAYSGVAHAGYMLVGLLAGPLAGHLDVGDVGFLGRGTAALLYYMVVYGVANLGAFAILGVLRVREGECETLRDVAGLLRREPVFALLLALAMFTLMGLPPTPGFWGKLGLFSSALAAARSATDATVSTWLIVLVVVGVLNSALAAAYYLRVVAAVLLYDNEHPAEAAPREAQQIGALVCGFLLLIFAFWPGGLIANAQRGGDELLDQLTLPAEVAAYDRDSPAPPPRADFRTQ